MTARVSPTRLAAARAAPGAAPQAPWPPGTGPRARTRQPAPWVRGLWPLALVLLVGMAWAVDRAPPSAHSGITLNLDWDTCDDSQWTATGHGRLEAGTDPRHQSVVTSSIRRSESGCADRFEIHDDRTDINAGFRSLWARYDSGEGTTGGVDFVYGLSFRVSSVLRYVHIWELQKRANLYADLPQLSVAPHALLIRDGQLQYREMTGAARWEDGRWAGWSNYQDQRVVLARVSPDTWYDVMIRIRTSEGADGLTQVYARQAGQAWPTEPDWQNRGPSLPYIPGGLDPDIPRKISVYQPSAATAGLTGLYVEAGVYTGSSSWQEATSRVYVYLDELRRYATLASARAGFPRR